MSNTHHRESGEYPCGGEPEEKSDAELLWASQKPLHNLPRGKNTWDPAFIKIWWFWPASVVFIIVLAFVYPLIWDFFSSN
ncbi:hypothetical protein SAMN04488082_102242 [Desulfomicrobium apsheronum]|uniref:Uncharacterized protein n=1 Tax=Desulfomicrobium apsheronum TaxID=52560 RepID=A0A1I3Q6C9_9BACT|nr:hypothetical protein [Desulfomicrobium apsheronum]SFJ29794.1 hypothetical protein SAMN04488082_102242 [Desulfomicrobium apsheronum]